MRIRDGALLGNVLGVWAHPDDEAYLSAGIMAAAVQAGHRVVCVTATRGEAGTDDPETFPPDRLAELREHELAACLGVLGVTEHRWLGHPDGGCAAVPLDDAVEPLVTLLRDFRPDTVLTFGPEGMTGHPDHIAVSVWTTEAVRRSGVPARLLYATNTPEFNERFYAHVDPDLVMMADIDPPSTPSEECAVHLRLDGESLELKVKALAAQASQTASLVAAVGEDVYRVLISEEAFREA